ncbi:MAG: hypothetical protein GY817_08910 [bacterium]|nr:hypothetical protein [bacterium]
MKINIKKLTNQIFLLVLFSFMFNICQQFSYAKTSPLVQNNGIFPSTLMNKLATFKGSQDKKIYIINDLHCNYEVQNKIAGILDFLSEKYVDRLLIGVEGNSGLLNQTRLKMFSDGEVKARVLKELLAAGVISGWEKHASNTNKSLIFGVEDQKLYQANFKSLYQSMGHYDFAVILEQKIKLILEIAQSALLSKHGRELLAQRRLYLEGKLKFKAWVEILLAGKISNKINFTTPQLELFKNLSHLEDRIDFNLAMLETEDIVKNLAVFLTKNERQELKKSQATSIKVYYHYLAELLKAKNIILKRDYFHFNLYLKLLKMKEQLDWFKLNEEVKELYYEIQAKHEQRIAKELIYVARYFDLMIRYSRNETSARESELWLGEQDGFVPRLKNLIQKLSIKDYLSLNEGLLKEVLVKINRFYLLVNARNEVMVNNLLKSMQTNDKDIGALVVGGYHSGTIKKILRNKGISYEELMPSVDKVANLERSREVYFSRLKEQGKSFRFAPVQNMALPKLSLAYLALGMVSDQEFVGNIIGVLSRLDSKKYNVRFLSELEEFIKSISKLDDSLKGEYKIKIANLNQEILSNNIQESLLFLFQATKSSLNFTAWTGKPFYLNLSDFIIEDRHGLLAIFNNVLRSDDFLNTPIFSATEILTMKDYLSKIMSSENEDNLDNLAINCMYSYSLANKDNATLEIVPDKLLLKLFYSNTLREDLLKVFDEFNSLSLETAGMDDNENLITQKEECRNLLRLMMLNLLTHEISEQYNQPKYLKNQNRVTLDNQNKGSFNNAHEEVIAHPIHLLNYQNMLKLDSEYKKKYNRKIQFLESFTLLKKEYTQKKDDLKASYLTIKINQILRVRRKEMRDIVIKIQDNAALLGVEMAKIIEENIIYNMDTNIANFIYRLLREEPNSEYYLFIEIFLSMLFLHDTDFEEEQQRNSALRDVEELLALPKFFEKFQKFKYINNNLIHRINIPLPSRIIDLLNSDSVNNKKVMKAVLQSLISKKYLGVLEIVETDSEVNNLDNKSEMEIKVDKSYSKESHFVSWDIFMSNRVFLNNNKYKDVSDQYDADILFNDDIIILGNNDQYAFYFTPKLASFIRKLYSNAGNMWQFNIKELNAWKDFSFSFLDFVIEYGKYKKKHMVSHVTVENMKSHYSKFLSTERHRTMLETLRDNYLRVYGMLGSRELESMPRLFHNIYGQYIDNNYVNPLIDSLDNQKTLDSVFTFFKQESMDKYEVFNMDGMEITGNYLNFFRMKLLEMKEEISLTNKRKKNTLIAEGILNRSIVPILSVVMALATFYLVAQGLGLIFAVIIIVTLSFILLFLNTRYYKLHKQVYNKLKNKDFISQEYLFKNNPKKLADIFLLMVVKLVIFSFTILSLLIITGTFTGIFSVFLFSIFNIIIFGSMGIFKKFISSWNFFKKHHLAINMILNIAAILLSIIIMTQTPILYIIPFLILLLPSIVRNSVISWRKYQVLKLDGISNDENLRFKSVIKRGNKNLSSKSVMNDHQHLIMPLPLNNTSHPVIVSRKLVLDMHDIAANVIQVLEDESGRNLCSCKRLCRRNEIIDSVLELMLWVMVYPKCRDLLYMDYLQLEEQSEKLSGFINYTSHIQNTILRFNKGNIMSLGSYEKNLNTKKYSKMFRHPDFIKLGKKIFEYINEDHIIFLPEEVQALLYIYMDQFNKIYFELQFNKYRMNISIDKQGVYNAQNIDESANSYTESEEELLIEAKEAKEEKGQSSHEWLPIYESFENVKELSYLLTLHSDEDSDTEDSKTENEKSEQKFLIVTNIASILGSYFLSLYNSDEQALPVVFNSDTDTVNVNHNFFGNLKDIKIRNKAKFNIDGVAEGAELSLQDLLLKTGENFDEIVKESFHKLKGTAIELDEEERPRLLVEAEKLAWGKIDEREGDVNLFNFTYSSKILFLWGVDSDFTLKNYGIKEIEKAITNLSENLEIGRNEIITRFPRLERLLVKENVTSKNNNKKIHDIFLPIDDLPIDELHIVDMKKEIRRLEREEDGRIKRFYLVGKGFISSSIIEELTKAANIYYLPDLAEMKRYQTDDLFLRLVESKKVILAYDADAGMSSQNKSYIFGNANLGGMAGAEVKGEIRKQRDMYRGSKLPISCQIFTKKVNDMFKVYLRTKKEERDSKLNDEVFDVTNVIRKGSGSIKVKFEIMERMNGVFEEIMKNEEESEEYIQINYEKLQLYYAKANRVSGVEAVKLPLYKMMEYVEYNNGLSFVKESEHYESGVELEDRVVGINFVGGIRDFEFEYTASRKLELILMLDRLGAGFKDQLSKMPLIKVNSLFEVLNSFLPHMCKSFSDEIAEYGKMDENILRQVYASA